MGEDTVVDLSAKLYHAVHSNNCVELQELIDNGADVNQFFDDLSHRKAILHFACANGRTDCVRVLLSNGASVNVKDKWRMTPFMYCISTSNYEIARMLLQMDPETIHSQDTNGKSALHVAVGYGLEDATRFLLRMGANVNVQDFNGYSPIMSLMAAKDVDNYFTLMRILIEAGANIHLQDFRDQRTSLHLAVISKKVDAVKLLLDLNADPNHLDTAGKTPLINLLDYHFSIYQLMPPVKDDVMTIAVLLTHAGTEMNIMTKYEGEYCNPLIMVTRVKCHQLIRLFLEHGANVNVKLPFSNETPLMIAVKNGDTDAIRIFLEWNCKLNIIGKCRIVREYNDYVEFSVDPFELAISQGHFNEVRLMILGGYNVSKFAYLRDSCIEDDDIPSSLRNNQEMLDFLRNCGSSPDSLGKLCTLIIFKSIKSDISNKVELLPLPSTIKRYLKYYYSN